jgi:hypothetical protein
MADEKAPETKPGEKNNRDEVALEMMKFVAVTTGYGKGTPAAGFTGKGSMRTPEEYADALLELFQKCRKAVAQPVPEAE